MLPTALAVASGLLLAAAFPPLELSALAWVGLAPLLVAVQRSTRLRAAFGIGWLAGFVFFLVTTHWITATIDRFTDLPQAVALAAPALVAGVLGAYTGAFAAGVQRLRRARLPLLALAPALWVALEWARGWFLIGFPWEPLGASQYRFRDLVQIADVTGVYGISAVLVLTNAALAGLLDGGAPPARRMRGLAAALAVAAGVLAYGHWRVADLEAREAGAATVAVVQGNAGEERKWDPAFATETLRRYAELTQTAATASPDLIVWPETAVPFFFQDPGRRREQVVELVRTVRAPLLFGSPAYAVAAGRVRQTNRTYLLAADGEVAGSYDKIQLVPFGETVPFASLLFFVHRLVPAAAELVAGTEATVFAIPAGRFGALICYEGIFPELARRPVADGADFLVNVSNDAWFAGSAALAQHLSQITLRAVENRVPIVRAANTGISAFVDADGGLRWTGPVDRATWHAERIHWPGVRTVYTRFGNLFAWACALAAAGGLALAWRRRNQ